jgi:hypothetical protein
LVWYMRMVLVGRPDRMASRSIVNSDSDTG